MTIKTPGQLLASELRRYFSVGPSSRRFRHGGDLHQTMVEAIRLAATTPGYYTERTEAPLRAAFAVALSYDKHIRGHRIDGPLNFEIQSMTPWRFAALLGEMLDWGVTNVGEGEFFFQSLAVELRHSPSGHLA